MIQAIKRLVGLHFGIQRHGEKVVLTGSPWQIGDEIHLTGKVEAVSVEASGDVRAMVAIDRGDHWPDYVFLYGKVVQ